MSPAGPGAPAARTTGTEALAVVVTAGVTPYLRRTLRSVARQSVEPEAVIVIDVASRHNGLGDGTPVEEVVAASGIDRGGRRQACARALWQLVVARALDDPDDPLHRTAGHVLGVLSPHREDRRYLDAFGPLHRRLLDPLCHVQLLLDPRMRAEIRRRTGTVAAGPGCRAGR